jgi:hypothetical protein
VKERTRRQSSGERGKKKKKEGNRVELCKENREATEFYS